MQLDGRKGILPVKTWGGYGCGVAVSSVGVAPTWTVGASASIFFLCSTKPRRLMFLLVPAYPGCPGQTAVKWLLLLLLLSVYCSLMQPDGSESDSMADYSTTAVQPDQANIQQKVQ